MGSMRYPGRQSAPLAFLHAAPNAPWISPSATSMEQPVCGLIVTDHDGIVVYADNLATQIFHREARRIIGQPFGYHVATGKRTVIEIFSHDGTPSQAELSVEGGEWDGKAAYVIKIKQIARDLDQKITDSLQKSNHHFLAMINASPLAIVTLNSNGSIILWSRAAEKMFGWRSHEVLGQAPPISSVDGNDDFSHWCDQAMDKDAPHEIELPAQRRRDGGLIDLRIWAANLTDESGFMGSLMTVIAEAT